MDSRAVNPINATPETTRVVVSNYTCMAITIVVIGARFGLANLKWKRKIGLDDLFLYLALVTGIIESVLTEHSVRRGLGTYIRPGNAAKLRKLSQIVYASDLFFLITMLLVKISVVRLVYRFATRSSISKGKLMALQLSIAIWGAFAIPAIAFQCGTPYPWLYLPTRCTASGALWYPTLVLSILVDAWLAVCAWPAMPDMQIAAKQRQAIVGLFSTRFLVCILGVAHIALLSPALKDINQPRAMPNPTVLKQIVMNASILSAAIPVLYKVLAQYVHTPSAQAVIYNTDAERNTTTPLEELKVSNSTILPNPKKFDGMVSETEIKAPPSLGNDDFSSRLSTAFNKEIGLAPSKA